MSSLSIILPAYNEEANVENAVREVSLVAHQLGLVHEIIVVNDGSTDRTGAVVREMLDRIPSLRLVEHYPNRGYGGALKAGFAAATKDLITYFPADKQFEFSEVARLLARIKEADIVCGFRSDRQDNLIRKLNGFGWKMVVRMLFGYLCRDIDCGFKLFRRRVLSKVELVSNGAMVDTELLAGARARGLRIVEEPLTHLPRVAGEATGANARVILRAFRDLVQFRFWLSYELRAQRQLAQEAVPVQSLIIR